MKKKLAITLCKKINKCSTSKPLQNLWLTPFFPMFSFDPPENKKPKVF